MNPSQLILGSSGLIGGAVVRELRLRGTPFLSASRSDPADLRLDLSDPQTWQALPEGPGVVLIAVGRGNLKECVQDPLHSRGINVEGTACFAELAVKRGWVPVLLSSSYVFQGTKAGVPPQDQPNPLCEYGRQKADLEQTVRQSIPQAVVVRVTKVFGDTHPLVLSWRRDLMEGKTVFAAKDVQLSPLSTRFIGRALADMLKKPHPGIWQLSASDEISWFEIGRRVADRCGLNQERVVAVPYNQIDPKAEFLPLHGSLQVSWPFPLKAPLSSEAIEQLIEKICSAEAAKCASV